MLKSNGKNTVVSWQNSNGAYVVGSFLFYCAVLILLLATAVLIKGVTYSIWGIETQASVNRLVEAHSSVCEYCYEVDYSYLPSGSEQRLEARRNISESQVKSLIENQQLSITYLAILPSNSIFGKTWDDIGITLTAVVIGILGAILGNSLAKGHFAVLAPKLANLKSNSAA